MAACFVSLVELDELSMRIKIERCDGRLDPANLASHLAEAAKAWLQAQLHATSASPCAPMEAAAQKTFENFKFRSSGKVGEERIERAVALGHSWGRYRRGEAVKPPPVTDPQGKSVIFVVLRPHRGSNCQRPSVHNRKGSLEVDDSGYLQRVAVPTPGAWSREGTLCEDAIYLGFGSLEEAFSYLQAAGCSPMDTLDCRSVPGSGQRVA